jgi:hypothetical protein
MKKESKTFLLLCLTAVFLLGSAGQGNALSLLDEKLTLVGFLRNETGMRLKDRIHHDPFFGFENAKQEENQLSVMRTVLQVEGQYTATDNLKFKFIGRAHYNARWDLDNAIDLPSDGLGNQIWKESELRAQPDGEYLETDIDLREYVVRWDIGNFFIKAGRQQIAWGEADAIRIADIINPLDNSRDFATSAYNLEWEDIRIPQRMIQLTYVVPESANQYEIEAVINPEDTRVNTNAPYGETYYMKNGDTSWIPFQTVVAMMGAGGPAIGGTTRNSLQKAIDDATDDALPENNSNRFAGGIRLRGVFGNGWDTHVYYYYQRAQNPTYTSSGNFNGTSIYGMPGPPSFGLPPFPWDTTDENLGIKCHFPHINTIGGTLNWFSGFLKGVFRGEFGYTIDNPYTGLRQGMTDISVTGIPVPVTVAWDGWFNDEIVYKDTVQYMIGFDRPTWIPFLNSNNTFFITGQFYHRMVLDYNDEVAGENNRLLLDTVAGKDGSSDHQYLFSLKINTKYYDDRIKPDILTVWDVNGHSGFIKPSIGYEPTYNWRFELGAIYFWADEYGGSPFSWVKDDDQIYGMIEWRF